MGRDLCVRFYKSAQDKKSEDEGLDDYSDHRHDFSLNGARNTDWPWYWSGTRMDVISEITRLASKIKNYSDHLAGEFVDENDKDFVIDEEYYCLKIESKATELGQFSLVLSECPIDCDYIDITNH